MKDAIIQPSWLWLPSVQWSVKMIESVSSCCWLLMSESPAHSAMPASGLPASIRTSQQLRRGCGALEAAADVGRNMGVRMGVGSEVRRVVVVLTGFTRCQAFLELIATRDHDRSVRQCQGILWIGAARRCCWNQQNRPQSGWWSLVSGLVQTVEQHHPRVWHSVSMTDIWFAIKMIRSIRNQHIWLSYDTVICVICQTQSLIKLMTHPLGFLLCSSNWNAVNSTMLWWQYSLLIEKNGFQSNGLKLSVLFQHGASHNQWGASVNQL